MKKRLILTACVAAALAALLFVIAPRFESLLDPTPRTAEEEQLREVGLALFEHANTHGGRYPESLKALEENHRIQKHGLQAFLKDPKLAYQMPEASSFSIKGGEILLTYELPDGKLAYTSSNTLEFYPAP